MKTRSVALLSVCAAFLIGAFPAAAQIRITGAISGTVTDADDAVVTGAAVLLNDQGTGITNKTVSGLIHLASCQTMQRCAEIGGTVV